MLGKLVQSSNHEVISGANQLQLDYSGLNGGIYFVKTTLNGKTGVAKLVIE